MDCLVLYGDYLKRTGCVLIYDKLNEKTHVRFPVIAVEPGTLPNGEGLSSIHFRSGKIISSIVFNVLESHLV